MLILELGDDGVVRTVIDTKASTRLSSGTHDGSAMAGEPLSRQFTALDKFAEILKENDVGSVVVCGTQVFRNASNGREVAEMISNRYGWRMEIISGEREAELSYRAATTGLQGVGEKRAVIDVGGGSSEVIIGTGNQIEWSRSYPIGAVSVTEGFENDLDSARAYVTDVAAELKQRPSKLNISKDEQEVYAVGGTAVTLAAVKLQQRFFSPKAIHGVRLTTTWIEDAINSLSRMGSEQRRELMPFDPDRADIIVGGALILASILEKLDATQVIVSNCGLRWGLIVASFPQLQQVQIEQ